MKHLAYGAAFAVGALALTAAGWLAIPASADDPSTAPVANSPAPAQPATSTTPPTAENPGCPPGNQQAAATHHYRARVHHSSQFSSVHSYTSYVEVPVPVPVYYPPPPPPAPRPVLYAGGPGPWLFHGGWRGHWGRRWY